MKRLDWLILKSYLGPFIMSFLIILFILVLQFMALYMREILGKGLGPDVLFKLFLYAGGLLSVRSVSVAILAAALMTYGSMGEHYELAAIKACGISVFKAMRSVILFALVLTGISLWFSFDVIPKASLKFFSLQYDIRRKKPSVAIKPGYFYSDIDGYVIRVTDKNNDTGKLYDVVLYNHTENRGNVDVILADSAKTYLDEQQSSLHMVMYNGTRHQEYANSNTSKPDNYSLGRMYFDSLYFKFRLSGFDLDRTDESQFRHQMILPQNELHVAIDSLVDMGYDARMKYFNQVARYVRVDTNFLTYRPDSLAEKTIMNNLILDERMVACMRTDTLMDATEMVSTANVDARAVKSYTEFLVKKKDDDMRSLRKYQYEYFLRFALPINCLLFMLIGASLGAIIRKGGLGVPAILSIICFIVFYATITYGKKLSHEGILEPWAGAGLPIFVFTPIAIIVTIQATMDAKILDESVWNMVRDHIFYRLSRYKKFVRFFNR